MELPGIKRVLSVLLPLVIGLACGMLFVKVLQNLSLKWGLFLFFAGCGLAMLLLMNLLRVNTKQMLLLGGTFLIPITYDINFMYQKDPPFFVHANGFGISITDVLFGMLIFTWIAETVLRKRAPLIEVPPVWKWLMSALLIVNLISSATTPEPFFGYSMVWQQIKVYVIFLFIVKNVHRIDTLQRIGYVCVAILFTQAVIVFEQKFLGVIFTAELLGQATTWGANKGFYVLHRVSGTLGQPNALAMFMNEYMLIGIFVAVVEQNTLRRLMLAIAVGLAVVAEIFTASRGGWLSLGVAFVLCAVLWRVRHGHGVVSSAALVSLLGSAVFGLLFIASESFRNRLTQDDMGTAEVRIPLMEVAENMIAANPVFGVGLNHYTYYMAEYDRTFDAIASNYALPVHNTFMILAAEIGIPGAALAVGLMLLTLQRALSVFWRTSDGIIAALSLGSFGGILAWMIHNTVDPTSIYADYPFWTLAALVLVMDRLSRKPSTENRVPEVSAL
jgi:putative inorganic carbon (HCO3(-)) transporter